MSTKSTFLAKSEIKAHDLEHKRKITFNIQKYADAVVKGKSQFSDLDLARRKAKNVKWKAIEHLDEYLLQFETAFKARGERSSGQKLLKKHKLPFWRFAWQNAQSRL